MDFTDGPEFSIILSVQSVESVVNGPKCRCSANWRWQVYTLWPHPDQLGHKTAIECQVDFQGISR